MVTVEAKRLGEPLQAVSADLQDQLVDLIDLALQAKQAHWNVVGPHFRELHLQLDELASSSQGLVDEVAERINAIGHNPDGQAKDVVAGATFKPLPSGDLPDHDVVDAFTERLQAAIARTRARVDRTGALDPVSQDLLIEVAAALEKQRWMMDVQRR